MVWYSHLFKIFPQFAVIHTVKDFSIVNEAEVELFLKFSCFLHDTTDVGNLISSPSASLKPSLHIWTSSGQVLLKSSLKDCEHYFVSLFNECNCMVVWTLFGVALISDWNEN